MIIVRVELHSAVDGAVTEIARAHISNVGGTEELGEYVAVSFKGRGKDSLDKMTQARIALNITFRRKEQHPFVLVRRALQAMGY